MTLFKIVAGVLVLVLIFAICKTIWGMVRHPVNRKMGELEQEELEYDVLTVDEKILAQKRKNEQRRNEIFNKD